jgi:hypothetical protein
MSHRTRIAALERRLAPANAMPTLIRITGGLPAADPMRTTVGGQELEREADETLRTKTLPRGDTVSKPACQPIFSELRNE